MMVCCFMIISLSLLLAAPTETQSQPTQNQPTQTQPTQSQPTQSQPTQSSPEPTSDNIKAPIETPKTEQPKAELKVSVYDKDDYVDKFGDYAPGEYSNLGEYRNDISSVKVPSGLELHMYDLNNFEGTKWVFKKDTPNIGDARNDVSSMKVIDIR